MDFFVFAIIWSSLDVYPFMDSLMISSQASFSPSSKPLMKPFAKSSSCDI